MCVCVKLERKVWYGFVWRSVLASAFGNFAIHLTTTKEEHERSVKFHLLMYERKVVKKKQKFVVNKIPWNSPKKYVFCAKISTRSFLSFSSCFVFSLKWVWINPHLILLTLQFISFNIQFSCTCRHNFCTLLLPFFSTIILWMNWKHDMWISSRALFPLNEKRICRVNLARRKKTIIQV